MRNNEDNYTILKFIYAKFNELESLKKFVTEEQTLKIIEAKQDTLNEMEKVIKSIATKNSLDI